MPEPLDDLLCLRGLSTSRSEDVHEIREACRIERGDGRGESAASVEREPEVRRAQRIERHLLLGGGLQLRDESSERVLVGAGPGRPRRSGSEDEFVEVHGRDFRRRTLSRRALAPVG
jgi:hypothetical protein